MLKDLFCESPFTKEYTLGNKIMAIILTNTCVIRYNFIDKELAETVY